jgi:hypothetical protein
VVPKAKGELSYEELKAAAVLAVRARQAEERGSAALGGRLRAQARRLLAPVIKEMAPDLV